jgi:hypothetical protein
MAKPAKKSLRPEASAPEPARRITPRTADRRLRILERLTTGLTVAHIAREEGLTMTRIRQILAAMLESRENPFTDKISATADRPTQRSHDRGAHDDEEGDVCAMDRLIRLTGELDRYHGFGRPTVSLPAEGSPPWRLAGPRRQLPASDSAPEEAETKIFLAARP